MSVVFPPSAADSPEMTRPLEKLRFPNSRLSVDEDEDTCSSGREVQKSRGLCCQRWRRLTDTGNRVPDWTDGGSVPSAAVS